MLRLDDLPPLPPMPQGGGAFDPARLTACLDLTSLGAADRSADVAALARRGAEAGVAAVCVWPTTLAAAKRGLAGSRVRTAVVAGGFPHGMSPLPARLLEIREAVALGADEVDVVIHRPHALAGRWDALHAEVAAMVAAAEGRTVKTILATGELGAPETIRAAALVALDAGSDFVKTSTGKEAVNATPEAAWAMLDALRLHRERTGRERGFKPAGGVRSPEDAALYARLAEAAMGEGYVRPDRFRLGASGLLDALLGSGY